MVASHRPSRDQFANRPGRRAIEVYQFDRRLKDVIKNATSIAEVITF
jgi:hypothetical protein